MIVFILILCYKYIEKENFYNNNGRNEINYE